VFFSGELHQKTFAKRLILIADLFPPHFCPDSSVGILFYFTSLFVLQKEPSVKTFPASFPADRPNYN